MDEENENQQEMEVLGDFGGVWGMVFGRTLVVSFWCLSLVLWGISWGLVESVGRDEHDGGLVQW